MADSVKIRILGDDSPFRKTLSGLGKVTSAAVKGIAASVGAISAAWSAAGVATVQAGSSFTSTMSEVQAISGATADEMARLESTAKELGASTSFSASEAGDALKYMALAGWDTQQSIDGLSGVLSLAAASGMELGAASDMVTDYLSAFGMEAKEAGYFSDMLAHAQSSSNTTAAALGEAYQNCAANLHAAGQSVETVTANLMGMANQGLKGATAGTALAAIMRDIGNKAKDGAIQVGNATVRVQDAAGNYRDLTDIMTDVSAAVAGMGTAQRAAALGATFTADSIKGVNLILNEGTDNIAGYADGLRDATGAAQEMSDVMLDNLQGDITMLKSALEGLQISAFEGMEGPARQAVQMVTEIVSQLNNAYKNGGLDGLVNSINAQIPKLTSAAVEAITKLFSAVSKKLPGLVKSLLSNLPSLLRSAIDLVPQLSDALFEMVSAAVETVASQLPELVPVLLEGTANLIASVGAGLIKAMDSLVWGLMKGIGLARGQFNGLADFADQGIMDELSKYIDGEIDTSNLDTQETKLTTRIQTLYDNVHLVLTDGMPDTEDVLKPIREEVDRIVAQLYSDIDTWEAMEIAKLDPTDPDFSAKCAAIKSEANSARTEVEGLHDGINDYIDTAAGKSAETVEASIGQLQTLTDQLGVVAEKYAQETQKLSPEYNAYQTVRAGAATNEQTVGLAIDYVVANYKLDQQSAEDSYNQTINQINEDLTTGKITSDQALELQEQAKLQLEIDEADAKQKYNNGIIEIMTGLSKTLSQEQQNALEDYAQKSNLAESVGEVLQGAWEGTLKPIDIPDSVTAGLLNLNLGDSTVTALSEAVNSGNWTADLVAVLGVLYAQAQAAVQEAGENTDFDFMASVWKTLVESGSNAGIDESEINYSLDELISGILSGKIKPVDIPVEGQPQVTLTEGETTGEQITNQVEGSTSDEMPVIIDVPIDATPEVSVPDDTGETIAQSVTENTGTPTVEQPVTITPKAEVATETPTTDMTMDVNATIGNVSFAEGGSIADKLTELFANSDINVPINLKLSTSDVAFAEGVDIQSAIDALIALQSYSSDISASVNVSVNSSTLAEGTDLQRIVNTLIAFQGIKSTTAYVDLSISVNSSNADSVGQGEGEALAAGIAAGITNNSSGISTAINTATGSAAGSINTSQAQGAGRNFAAGIAAGITAGRSAVIAAAAAVARAAVQTVQTTLQIHSPSRVTEQFGRLFDSGFAQGINRGLSEISASSINMAQTALSTVDSLISPANFTPRINAASLSGAFSDAAQDFAMFDAERPIALYVNGRELARVTDVDNASASSNLHKRIAVGYGK